jgi:hypothetical protein
MITSQYRKERKPQTSPPRAAKAQSVEVLPPPFATTEALPRSGRRNNARGAARCGGKGPSKRGDVGGHKRKALRDGALSHSGPRQAKPTPATALRYAPDISLIQVNPRPS